MTGPTTPAVWTFVLDEDEGWVASREPAGEENLRRAVETLLYGIASAKAAQVYLAAWRADTQRWGTGSPCRPPLPWPSASAPGRSG
ncbi:hypothetical protein [Streptomyces sp. NPDC088775]|uniref:hypothetical protein n=1 Tax=Streptomyces sp. NPDC088775 TaxID=3365896 RepID=UPI00382F52F5